VNLAAENGLWFTSLALSVGYGRPGPPAERARGLRSAPRPATGIHLLAIATMRSSASWVCAPNSTGRCGPDLDRRLDRPAHRERALISSTPWLRISSTLHLAAIPQMNRSGPIIASRTATAFAKLMA
jgi:hypothetical protein